MTSHPSRVRTFGRALSVFLALGLVAAACGDDDTTEDLGALDGTSSTMDMGDTDHEETFDFGEAADPADADRTVEVSTLDSFAYDPPSITVKVGETVLFEVTNDGKIRHEFTLGDEELQTEHEQEMSEMGGEMMMADEPNAIAIAPGETKQLAFTFTKAGTIEYACHVAGHFAAGMIGDITVE